MKNFLVILIFVFLFASCSEERTAVTEKPGVIPDKPSAGNYFTYTPIIDIFTPEIGGEISFLDFDGANLIMNSGTDKAFLLSHSLADGETENLSNIIGFHSAEFVSDGEYDYFIRKSSVLRRNIASGEETEIVQLEIEDFEYNSDYSYNLYKTGKYIVAEKAFENAGKDFWFYDSENGEIKFFDESSALSGHETMPLYGNITLAEEKSGGYSLFAVNPESKTGKIRGPVIAEEILYSAYDGKYFVWSTESGIYFKNSAGKNIQISEQGGKFGFLGRNYIVFSNGEKLVLYNIDKNRSGGYNGFSGLEFAFADENIAIFKSKNKLFGEEYLSIQIKVGEEPERLREEPDMAPPMIAVDGYDYYCYHGKSEVTPSENQIAGKITSVYDDHSTGPRRNNQGNSSEFLGSRYAFVDGNLLVESGGKWYKCEKGSALSEINMD